GATDNLRYIYRDMAFAFVKEKNSDSAEYYFSKTLNFIDSTNIEEGLQMSKEIEAKYETEKKELQLQKQAIEIDSKQKENDAKSRLLILSIVGLVGITVFAFFAYK